MSWKFHIEGAYWVTGRGCTVAGHEVGDELVSLGDRAILTPYGETTFETEIVGIETMGGRRDRDIGLLLKGVTKDQVRLIEEGVRLCQYPIDMRVYKYPLEITDTQVISSFATFTPLSTDVQLVVPAEYGYGEVAMARPQVFLWAMVDANSKRADQVINTVGTGNPVEGNPGSFVGTVQERGLVWHIFWGGRRTKEPS